MPLPAVAGTLITDLNPAAFDATARVNGATLTAANAQLIPVGGNPTYRTGIFASGSGAVRCVQSTQGFRVPCPLTDDFSIYVLTKNLVGSGAGGNWYSHAPLIDAELGGVTNDWGVAINAAGKIVAGTGNPDTSVTGTATVSGATEHVICVRRVKSTGVLEVYVDNVLDVTVAGNTNSLIANAGIYFGLSNSAGAAGGDVGRILGYDAAHANADRAAMTTSLFTDPPDPPPLRSSKVVGYIVEGNVPNVAYSTKALGYGVLGSGVDLDATKVVAYAVIEKIETLQSQVY